MSRRSPAVLALVVAVLVLTACTPNDTGGAPEPYTRTVGPEGGTISDPGGAILTIPAGVLAAKTAITVTTYQDTVDLGTAFSALAGAVCGVTLEAGSVELTFDSPVGLRITPLYALEGGGSYPVFYLNEESGKWEQTGMAEASEDGTYLETQIIHFSSYSVFDMPYDVLDDFVGYAEQYAVDFPEESAASYGELYAECVVFEEESFLGPDQYYNGCCYMRAKGLVSIDYSWDGEPHSYQGEYPGYETDTSYVLTYSGSGEHVSYTIELEVYLDCSEAESMFVVYVADQTLRKGESTEVEATFECGGEPVANRAVTFSLTGVGKLSGQTALTNDDGEATVTYSATADGTAEVEASLDGCSCENTFQDHDSATIVVSDGTLWTGTLEYTYEYDSDILLTVATWDVTFNFLQTGTAAEGGVSGVATATQTLNPQALDANYWIENISAPSPLDLVVNGVVTDGNVEMWFTLPDWGILSTYDLCCAGLEGPMPTLTTLNVGHFNEVALEPGTQSGQFILTDSDVQSFTLTLERADEE